MSITNDDLARWAHEQQAVAEASVVHNASAALVRGCVECGRMDTPVVYLFGRADHPHCADRGACERRQEALWSETAGIEAMW